MSRWIGARLPPTRESASGVWTLAEAMRYKAAGLWPGNKFDDAINIAGVKADLQCCIDVGATACYPGTGQTLTDLTGNANNFFLGADGSATSADPTFNGSVGGVSVNEYLSFDGGDYCRFAAANPTWVNNLHKDNALWSAAMWARIPATAAVRSIFGTARGSTNQTGVNCYYTSGNVLHFEAADGSAPAIMSADHGGSITANTWTFIGLSMNEAAGANGFAFAINDDVDLFTSTYATPSTNNATDTLEFGALGNANTPLVNGSRIACVAFWTRALSPAELLELFKRSRSRFGV